MKFFKPIAGLASVLFGAIGLILCLVAICGTWIEGNRVQNRIVQVSHKVKMTLGPVNERLDQIANLLQSARDGGNVVVRSVKEYSNGVFNNENASATISDIIDDQFQNRFHSIQRLSTQIQETFNALGHLFAFMNSISPVLFEKCAPDGPLMGPLRGVTGNLVQISGLLDKVKKRSDELRGNPDISQQVISELPDLFGQIDLRLGEIHDTALKYEKWVSEISAHVTDLKSRSGFWINTVAIIITLLLIWLGTGQLSLFIHGCQMFRTIRQG